MRNAKQIKRKKREQARNRKLVKKYGDWLIPKDWRGRIPKDYDWTYTYADSIPSGWRIAFGDMLLKELSDEIGKKEYYILQVKEKYGSLRWYHSYEVGIDPDKIIDKYSHISENVCISCGKPDVGITKGYWIEPVCEDCYNKHINSKVPYDEAVTEDRKIAESYVIRRYSGGVKTEETVDIKETVDKVRARWDKKHRGKER